MAERMQCWNRCVEMEALMVWKCRSDGQKRSTNRINDAKDNGRRSPECPEKPWHDQVNLIFGWGHDTV